MCYVTSRDYLIGESCNFILGFASLHVSTLKRLVAMCVLRVLLVCHVSCKRGYIKLLICHVSTHDQVVKESHYSIDGFLSPQVTNLPCLVFIDLVKKEILSFQLVTRSHVNTY